MVDIGRFSDEELFSILEFYAASGVDLAVGEEAVDRFAGLPQPQLATSPAPGDARAAPNAIETTLRADPAEAKALADAAPSIPALRSALEAYQGCGLRLRASRLVFADGNPEAQIMIVGSAPDAEDDREGRPFAGKAGLLLDRMLASIGLDRASTYLTTTLPWRPTGNRPPTPEELALCKPFLMRHLALASPQIVVTLGELATQTVLETEKRILQLRGKWADTGSAGHAMAVLPMLSPAQLLLKPAGKALAWRDLVALRSKLREKGLG